MLVRLKFTDRPNVFMMESIKPSADDLVPTPMVLENDGMVVSKPEFIMAMSLTGFTFNLKEIKDEQRL